jgi:cation:H+ antiporter
MTGLVFILGLACLGAGAELLVRGAARIATACGIAPLVVGLTIVAYGTSTPELAVNLKAAAAGQADLAIGNVIGSNIFNILLILGVCAVLQPLVVAAQLVRLDVPLLIGASLVVWGMSFDGVISRFDGAVLFAGIVVYTVFAIRQSRRETAAVQAEYQEAPHVPARRPERGAKFWLLQLTLILTGLAVLVVGARWVVDASVEIARALGVSELIIGLTIIAAGTSLPEVATSVVATVRGQRDIAIGNAVGSNLYNLGSILGLSALLAPDGLAVSPAVARFDLPVMTAVAVACLPVFFTGHTIARWEGGLFVGYYAAYTAYLVLAAREHDALPAFSAVMMWFVIPLTVVTLAVVVARQLAARKRAPA